ncbi:MAG: ferredoxin [Natronomonas sp.]
MNSPFEVLQVDPDADEEVIKAAYRERMKETHPDQGGSARAFQAVRTAYKQVMSGAAGSPGTTEGGDQATAEDSTPGAHASEPMDPEVEYLNYEVLDDYGWGLEDPDLFEKAADAGLGAVDYGRFRVQPGDSVLEAAEQEGYAWPYACRGGACANCAVVVRKGELSAPIDHILPDEMVEEGIQLSCNAIPLSDHVQLLYNVKHMPDLEELLLPPKPFEQAHADD